MRLRWPRIESPSIFFMAEDFGFFTEVYRKAYPKSVPPIKSLCQLILADIEKSLQKLDG